MATERQLEWRKEFVELVRKCWAYAKKFPKGERMERYRECMHKKGHVY